LRNRRHRDHLTEIAVNVVDAILRRYLSQIANPSDTARPIEFLKRLLWIFG
jgi:hypothetical protein